MTVCELRTEVEDMFRRLLCLITSAQSQLIWHVAVRKEGI
jgi:hypothetical protein